MDTLPRWNKICKFDTNKAPYIYMRSHWLKTLHQLIMSKQSTSICSSCQEEPFTAKVTGIKNGCLCCLLFDESHCST
jgi:hypothetical protein